MKKTSGSVFEREGSPYLWITFRRGGKRIRESANTTVWQEAEDLLRQRQQMISNGTLNTLQTKVDDLVQLVLQDYRLQNRSSIQDVEERWKNHLQPFFGGLDANQVTPELVTHYQEKRLDSGAANGSINRETAILRRAYTLGLKNKRVLHDHVPQFTKLREDNVRVGFVEPEQYSKLVEAFNKRGLVLRTLFECGYTYGWRSNELVTLRVRQIDLAFGVVRLDTGTTKNKKGRVAKITTTIKVLLTALVEGKKADDFVFTWEDGRPVLDFRGSWEAGCKEAGVPDLLFHDLRRTAVRNMVRAGVPENQAMKISGHITRSVFDRYDIVNERDIADSVQKVETYLASVTKKSVELPTWSQSGHTATDGVQPN